MTDINKGREAGKTRTKAWYSGMTTMSKNPTCVRVVFSESVYVRSLHNCVASGVVCIFHMLLNTFLASTTLRAFLRLQDLAGADATQIQVHKPPDNASRPRITRLLRYEWLQSHLIENSNAPGIWRCLACCGRTRARWSSLLCAQRPPVGRTPLLTM